jgi:hypothetical protein
MSLVLTWFGLLSPSVAAAQEVPSMVLSRPQLEFGEPFTNLRSVRELADGRVILLDVQEQALYLVDFGRETPTEIGRRGSGPGEYALPLSLLSLAGDTTLVFDAGNARYLFILPDGTPGVTFSLPSPSGEVSFQVPEAADAKGRIYFGGGVSFNTTGGGRPEIPDSFPIYRYDRASTRYDTLGYLSRPVPKFDGGGGAIQLQGGSGELMGLPRPQPFAPRDAWAVSADGRVGVARASTYRVEWWVDRDTRQVGPAIPTRPIRVTDRDKEAFKTQGDGRVMIMSTPGGSRRLPMPKAENVTFPKTKPPFLRDAVRAAPDGTLWVLRSRAADDPIPTYDVFDEAAQLVRRVVLPETTRLLGFGNGAVYLIRTDEDDLQWLQRYALER